MTRKGASKPADMVFATGRLAIARSFLKTAETALALSDRGDPQNPVISNLVLAAVAYCDALTAKYGGRVNQKDHGAVVKILRDALGNRLPAAQETKLSRILGIKDDVQYGSRPSTAAEAQRLLVLLREFARWAEEEFGR
jgi:hypothetical protein